MRALLEGNAEVRAQIGQPICFFDSPPIVLAASRNRATVEALLDYGADINSRSSWWAGSFGVLDNCDPGLAPFLIERGATVDINAAARLGMVERVRELLAVDAGAVHHRGGDGQTPLHVASTVEIAGLLLDHGADIDALDVDHESTPAQYRVRAHPDVVRFLVGRGCGTDILLAAALGDLELVRRHLEADPESIRMRVDFHWFPMKNPRAGGKIYIWTLGKNLSPHQVAAKFGHPEIREYLMEHSPAVLRLAEACLAGDEEAARAVSTAERDAGALLIAAEGNDTAAVRLMMSLDWPVEAPGTTALHWACWHGNAAMVAALLARHPPLEQRDPNFNGAPLGWALHGSQNSWHRATGDYPATVRALLAAGAKRPESEEGLEALRRLSPGA